MSAIDIKKLAPLLGRGIVSEFAPDILRGALIELFRAKKVNVAKVTEWVQANNSLWDSLEPKHQDQLKRLAQKLGDISFIDAAWAINALKHDFPAVASLFLGWLKSRHWLERQLDEIKKHLQQ